MNHDPLQQYACNYFTYSVIDGNVTDCFQFCMSHPTVATVGQFRYWFITVSNLHSDIFQAHILIQNNFKFIDNAL